MVGNAHERQGVEQGELAESIDVHEVPGQGPEHLSVPRFCKEQRRLVLSVREPLLVTAGTVGT